MGARIVEPDQIRAPLGEALPGEQRRIRCHDHQIQVAQQAGHEGGFGQRAAQVAAPVAVVCAGPKAILDVARTLEYLETRGVPVVAVGQEELPGFYARSAGIRAPATVPDVATAGDLVRTHLGLGLGSGIVVCVPVPAADALPEVVVREAVETAIRDADDAGIAGPALTPWLLARIGTITHGASIRANTGLIVNDARVAGELAVHLART